ncbi:uncharacterized protein LOC118223192 [Anguilla anguilla]|uniref:uncharacterized protein LOC118223192 n=1 Tax=Anguilla anguilla TaxID=7936 RepID=UPI0015AC7109|nr:uncharacterized protein LOC118223192 [Anguilla anguilla]
MEIGRAHISPEERLRSKVRGFASIVVSPAISVTPIQFGQKRGLASESGDAGADANFLDATFVTRTGIATQPLEVPMTTHALDGRALSQVTHITEPLQLLASGNHRETIQFHVIPSPNSPIVLGQPWFHVHNPHIDWATGRVLSWSSHCHSACLKSAPAPAEVAIPSAVAEPPNLATIPPMYHDLGEAFSKQRALSLPPHRPYDCGIDLLPGAAIPSRRLFNLSRSERKAMETYIHDSLAAGIIRPSPSPVGAGFFFINKKDQSLRPCIDYRELNNITVKNKYSLPLMNSVFEPLQEVLQCLLENKLFLKAEKYEFHITSVSFLGYVIESGRVRTDPEKIRAVAKWPKPSSQKQLQRFLGFANFYRRFIQDYSRVAVPLTHLTSSTIPFAWTPETDTTFGDLKRRFTSAPVLVHPDSPRQFVVEVDASETGVGAVLSQRSVKDQKLHPCAFSRRLSPAERNYDVGNRELLSVKLALEEWRHWLEGAEQPFVVWTDHKNLAYIQTAKSSPAEPDTILPPSCIVAAVTWEIESVIKKAQQSQPDPRTRLDRCLFVPDSVRSQVLQWVHSSKLACHPGINRTLFLLRRNFWWESMGADARSFVLACTVCACSKTSHQPPAGLLHPLPIPGRPWSHIGVDFVTGLPPSEGNMVILTIVDRFSKAVHFVPLPTAAETADLLVHHVVHLHGIPTEVLGLGTAVHLTGLEDILSGSGDYREPFLWLPPSDERANGESQPGPGSGTAMHVRS